MHLLGTLIILVCALGEHSFAEAVEKAPIPGCGTTYTCFVPESCTTDTASFSPATAVDLAKKNTPVTKDCAALIRFHAFTPFWMYVSIESFGAATSIEFVHKSADDEVSSFECKIDAASSEAKGAYLAVNRARLGDMIESVKSPLRCTFLLKTQSTKVNSLVGKTQFIVGGAQSDWSQSGLTMLNCDPLLLKFKPADNVKLDEKYAAVQFSHASPGKYECAGNLFNRLQYRADDSDSYAFATSLQCVGSRFTATVEGSSQPVEFGAGFVNIRCVANAEYFCKYRVKTISSADDPTVIAPLQDASDPSVPKKGEIKCPTTHPFIVVNGKPVASGAFKCQNRGAPVWTVNEQVLRENSAEVHCANELKCHILDKLPASSIRKGSLVNNIPTCRREDGTMKESHSSNIVTKIFCNKQTGKYMYTTGGQDVEVGKTTFYCEYPKFTDTRKNSENKKEAIEKGIISTAGIIVGSIVLVSVGIFLLSCLRFHLLERKMMKMDDAAFNDYCTGEAAKKKREREKKEQENKHKKTDKEQSDKSNNGLMNAYILSMRQKTTNSAFPNGIIEKNQYVSKCLSKMTTVTVDNVQTVRKATEEEPVIELSPETGVVKGGFDDAREVMRALATNVMAPSEGLEKSARDLDEEKKNN